MHGANVLKKNSLPNRSTISPTDPLRLAVAAALAFPDGSMTVSGLRREAAAGRLVVEKIAGKMYTTLAEIEAMRSKCRVTVKQSGPRNPTPQDAKVARAALQRLARERK